MHPHNYLGNSEKSHFLTQSGLLDFPKLAKTYRGKKSGCQIRISDIFLSKCKIKVTKIPSFSLRKKWQRIRAKLTLSLHQPQNGVYSPYSQGSWPGSPNSQPSPQPNNYYGPGPGPVDGGGYNGAPPPHPGPPPVPAGQPGQNGGQGQDFYNNYQCNQYDFNYYNNYQYNYNIKSEYHDMKPDIIGQQPAHHHPQPPPGANPYYGGNGHVSPHNQHLMSGMPPTGTGIPSHGNMMPMDHGQQNWANPKMMHQTNGKRKDGCQQKITDSFKTAKKPRTSNGPKRTNNR